MIEFVKNMFLPSQLSALLLFFGMTAMVSGKYRRLGTRCLIGGALMFLFFSSGVVASFLIGPLEARYPPLVNTSAHTDVTSAVVLTAFATTDDGMPLSSQAGSSSLYRVMETVQLYQEAALDSVFVSGDETAGKVIVELLVSAGIPRQAITLDGTSYNTAESPQRLEAALGAQFFLVTSAGHMPRAMAVFHARGMEPIPAPTDFQLPQDPGMAKLSPSPYHLFVSDLAVHEYLGLVWYRLTGKTKAIW